MGEPRCILLAEDDGELRELIQRFLEARNHRVVSVDDGLELADYLLLASTNRNVPEPDLILADLRMPGKNALEVFEEFGTAGKFPVVLLTAFADEAIRKRAAEAGVTLVLAKPIVLPALASIVEALLASTRALLAGVAATPSHVSG